MQHWGTVGFKDTKFSKIFAGHFHCSQQYDNVYIPGSPLPFRFDEGMVDHGFYVFNIENDEVDFIDIKVGEKLLGTNAPPDYITIAEDDIGEIDARNCNVRVVLNSTKSRDELDTIRGSLEGKGAIKVSWMKTKEDESSVAPEESAILEPHNLFERYIEFDKPKDLNKQLLLSLNKKIVEEAFDIQSDDE